MAVICAGAFDASLLAFVRHARMLDCSYGNRRFGGERCKRMSPPNQPFQPQPAPPQPSAHPRVAGWSSLLRTVRAPLFLLVAAGVALLVPEQTQDMLDALSDGDFNDWWRSGSFHFSLFLLALSSWYWSRALLAARFDLPDTLAARNNLQAIDPGLDRAALDFIPRMIFVLALLVGTGVILRSDAWSNLPYLIAWAIPLAFLVFYRLRVKAWLRRVLGLGPPPSTAVGEGINKTGSIKAWRSKLRARFNLLMLRAPFSDELSPWAAFAGLCLGLLGFLLGALQSFGFLDFVLPANATVPSIAAAWFPGPGVVLFALAMMIPPFATLTFLFDGLDSRFLFKNRLIGFRRPPVIALLLIWTMVMPVACSLHTVRVIEDAKEAPLRGRAPLEDMFADWVKTCADADTSKEIRPVIVAISGGATRAAVWGARVLEQIENNSGPGKPTIFAVSSVSGGSLGTAGYFSLLSQLSSSERCAGGATETRRRQVSDLANPRLAHDALGPLLAGALFVDTPRAMLAPFASLVRLATGVDPRGGDRGEAIERAFEQLWRTDIDDKKPQSGNPLIANATSTDTGAGAAHTTSRSPAKRMDFGEPFLSLFYEGDDIRHGMPLWIANGTDLNAGGRTLTVPFSPKGEWPFSAATDTLSQLGADVPISTAINNTARFPFLEPSGELLRYKKAVSSDSDKEKAKDEPKTVGGQIIDGGYFENDGLQTALDLARWLAKKSPDGRTVLPIIVLATADGDAKITSADVFRCGSPKDNPKKAVVVKKLPLQTIAPIFGLYNVRAGHTAVLLREAKDAYCGDNKRFFHFFLTGKDGTDVPLNWILSTATARSIQDAIDTGDNGNADEKEALRKAFEYADAATRPLTSP